MKKKKKEKDSTITRIYIFYMITYFTSICESIRTFWVGTGIRVPSFLSLFVL